MKNNPSRAYAPIRELRIMKINYNNPNNWQIIGINRDYCGLLEIIAIICLKFYNVHNKINLDYWFAVLLLHIIVIIACIVIIGFYILVLLADITCLCQIYDVHGLT